MLRNPGLSPRPVPRTSVAAIGLFVAGLFIALAGLLVLALSAAPAASAEAPCPESIG